MNAALASIVTAVLKLVAKPFALWMAWIAGKRSARAELKQRQDALNAKAQKEFAKIAGEHRDSDDVVDRLRDKDF